MKVCLSLRQLDDLKCEVKSKFARENEDLYILLIKEYTGYLKRKGVQIDLEIEEATVYADE